MGQQWTHLQSISTFWNVYYHQIEPYCCECTVPARLKRSQIKLFTEMILMWVSRSCCWYVAFELESQIPCGWLDNCHSSKNVKSVLKCHLFNIEMLWTFVNVCALFTRSIHKMGWMKKEQFKLRFVFWITCLCGLLPCFRSTEAVSDLMSTSMPNMMLKSFIKLWRE